MSYLIESAQREMARIDRLHTMEDLEPKFCDCCGTTLDLQEEFTCLDCLEEIEKNKVFTFKK